MLRRVLPLLLALLLAAAPAAARQQLYVPGAPTIGVTGQRVSGGPTGSLASRFALHARAVAEGDSITAGSSGPTFLQYAIMASGGRYFMPSGYNKAVGGETAAQMAAGAQTSAVTALNPKIVYYLSGTNDLSGTADTPAAIFANQRTAVETYRAAGARVIFITTLPRTAASWPGSNRETDRQALVDLQRAQSDVVLVDMEASFNPDTMTLDGLHPNQLGAITLGNAAGAAAATQIVGDSIFTGYLSADNFLVGANENPALTGTTGSKGATGSVTGDVATSWTAETNDAGIVVVASKTTLNGRDAQRLVVSGTNGVAGRLVNMRNVVTYSGSAGQFWEVWWDVSLASGHANLRAINATTDTGAMPVATSVIPSTSALSGAVRPPMTTALAGADTSVTIQIPMTFAAGTIAADLIVAGPYYRQVPTDQ